MSPDEIRALLAAKGLSQADVARKIGVAPPAINDIVQGRTVRATARFAFAYAIGEDPEKIWPRERAETPKNEEPAA